MILQTSERYCLNCEKVTTFKYNKNIGHSECNICGGRLAVNSTTLEIKFFLDKIKTLKSELENYQKNKFENLTETEKIILLNDKIKNQRTHIQSLEKKIINLEKK